MSHPRSIWQQKIIDVLTGTDKNIVVQATAGAGKTTTILDCLNFIPKFKRSIFLSFSTGIVKELGEKIPTGTQALTLHSLGYRLLLKRYGDLVKRIEENKFFLKCLTTFYKGKETSKAIFRDCFRVQDICSFVRMTLTPLDFLSVKEVCEHFNIDYTDELINQSIELLKQKEEFKHGIDFVDMIYLPLKLEGVIDVKYDYIFLDEAQDLNECQFEFIQKILSPRGGRLISVGDENQCQPIDTKIQMRDGTVKNIIDIEIGEVVTSYETETSGCYVNYSPKNKTKHIPKNGIVLDKKVSNYSGNLYTVKLENGLESRYTKDHLCCFKMIDDSKSIKKYMVYLMEKDGLFRVGYSRFWGKENGFGLTNRCGSEDADKGWVLQLFDTKEEAYIHESLYSYKFGIPKLVFKDGNNKTDVLGTKTCIDKFWSLVDKKELYNNGLKCLSHFDKDIRYPLYYRNRESMKKNVRASDCLMFYTQVCNLIPEVMMCNTFDITSRNNYGINKKWVKIVQIEKEKVENLEVVSLSVSGTELYVGDNILTHNCIYGFMGSSIDNFNKLKNLPNTEVLTLPVSYRCPKKVVELASTKSTLIKPFEEKEDGVVRYGMLDEVQQGDIVLSRNTRPLIYAYLYLLESGKKAVVVGKEIEKGLVKLVERCEAPGFEEFYDNLDQEMKRVRDELLILGHKNLNDHPRVVDLDEKINVLCLLLKNCSSPSQLTQKIREIFVSDKKAIKLMTIHKSKGLENDRIFMIMKYEGVKLLPSKYANKKWELEQEDNLEFVGYTRTKKELVLVNLN